MTRRSKSSRQWLHEHFTDPLVDLGVATDILAMPGITGGMDVIDHAKSAYLGELALDMAGGS